MNNLYLTLAFKRFGYFHPFRSLKAALVMSAVEEDLREESMWDLPLTADNLKAATRNSLAFVLAKAGVPDTDSKMASVAKTISVFAIKWCAAEELADSIPHWYLLPLGLPEEVKQKAIAGGYKTIGDLFQAAPFDFI